MPMTDSEFERFRIVRGDVLLNEGQSLDLVGRCSLYDDEFAASCAMQNQLLRFRARSGTSPEFAAHLFRECQKTGKFLAIATQTTSVAHLGSTRFANLTLLWPDSESEQQAIADILTDIDTGIVALDRLVAKVHGVKQGMMQQLLTGETRLGGLDSHWPRRRISELVDGLEAGVSVRSTTGYRQGPSVLKTSSVDKGRFIPGEAKPILESDLVRARVRPTADAMIISRMNTPALVGAVGYVAETYPDLFLPDRLWLARRRNGTSTDMRWLTYLLAADPGARLLRGLATGTSGSMKNIPKERLLAVEINVPGEPEQRQISAVLADVDDQLDALTRRASKARSMKQGMLQQLLAGRVRLPVEAAP